MKTIFKYTLLMSASQIRIPGLIKVKSVMEQHGDIVLYALVDTDCPDDIVPVDYVIYGTGHPVDMEVETTYDFQGTVKLANGMLMFHVYTKQSNR